jgi:hypothetical protein
MAKGKKDGPESGLNDSNDLSLSEALLAPLNSIFEAQVHASRAFLNFFLQMGFRHKYTEEDIASLRSSDTAEDRQILKQIEEEDAAKKEMASLAATLTELNKKNKAELSDSEKQEISSVESRLRELKVKWGALYQQAIEYIDQNGIERTIFIPNLALLPFQPLGISGANFKYELRVTQSSKSDNQIKTASGATQRRPWFLIDPKQIKGEFAPQQKEDASDKTIKMDITIGKVDIPYGLHKLLTSLTGIAQDTASTPPQSMTI